MSELNQFFEAFEAESEERLRAMETQLLDLEAGERESADWDALFREVHTIKGNASMLGFEALTSFTHELEEFLSLARQENLESRAELFDVLLQVVDRLREKVADALRGRDQLTKADSELLAALAPYSLAADGDLPVEATRVRERAATPDKAAAETLRVRVSALGEMMDLIGEVSVARRRLTRLIEEEADPGLLRETNEEMDRLFQSLQSLVMGVRMVPVSRLFEGFRRVVRDLGQDLGKKIELVTSGDETGLDTSMVERLKDPLTHLIRNAADHGIEAPEEREKGGKPPTGRIELRARQEGGMVIIEVTDDGRGIDANRVAEKAIERGLVGREKVETMADEEKMKLIFEAGFSTATHVTDVSGRGVGMDSVRADLEALRGGLMVQSEPGGGSTFQLRIPLTVSLIDALEVRVGSEHYVVPLDTVVECVSLSPAGSTRRVEDVFALRGTAVPYVRLARWLGLGEPEPNEELLVVRRGGDLMGLSVDQIIGAGQFVIKPLGEIGKASGFSGSTVLDSGEVGLILDTEQFFIHAAR